MKCEQRIYCCLCLCFFPYKMKGDILVYWDFRSWELIVTLCNHYSTIVRSFHNWVGIGFPTHCKISLYQSSLDLSHINVKKSILKPSFGFFLKWSPMHQYYYRTWKRGVAECQDWEVVILLLDLESLRESRVLVLSKIPRVNDLLWLEKVLVPLVHLTWGKLHYVV